MLVTISGPPGAGTSTVAKLVAARLGLERVDGGSVFRQMAAERGLDLVAFSSLAERDTTIDVALDERLAARARSGAVVLESRLAGWIARNEGLPATTVWIDADEGERARRVAVRYGIDPAAAAAANRRRNDSERLRYRTYYGIDLGDRSVYDLVLDSTSRSPEELTESIVAATTR